MKSIQRIVILVFSFIILLPLILFNFQKDAVSELDNRMLAPSPFEGTNGSMSDRVDNYVNDRIGLREDMIYAYTMLNDAVFGKLTHPSYIKGNNGYIFGTEATQARTFGEYHIDFANMVSEIQTYCSDRGVPFVFAFNPSKSAVLTEHLPEGINYNRDWVDSFFAELDRLDVCYVDNTTVLREQSQAGKVVFNQQYDANHWNDLGAYYGTNEILKALHKQLPAVHVNTWEELKVSYKEQTQLPNSVYPICEKVPSIAVNTRFRSIANEYNDEVERHSSYRGFNHFVNETRIAEGAPKALVFQGSYMNGCGYKYLANSFGEYIYVHDYQNVMDFSYYYNIFQPDCVVFEVAEYTLVENYFSQKKIQEMALNPSMISVDQTKVVSLEPTLDQITIEKGATLTKIYWKTNLSPSHVWFCGDTEYDMKYWENGFSVTLPNEVYKSCADTFTIRYIK